MLKLTPFLALLLALSQTQPQRPAPEKPGVKTPGVQIPIALLKPEAVYDVPGAPDPDPVMLSRGRVAEWVRSQLYRLHDAAAIPWFLHRAYAGDWSPIVDNMLSYARDIEQDLSFGLFFASTCNEDVPFVNEKDVAAATRDTFLGDYRLR